MKAITKAQPDRVVFVILRDQRTHFQYVEPDWKPMSAERQAKDKKQAQSDQGKGVGHARIHQEQSGGGDGGGGRGGWGGQCTGRGAPADYQKVLQDKSPGLRDDQVRAEDEDGRHGRLGDARRRSPGR